MNKARRKKLQELMEQLETIKEELEQVQEEEQEAYDNLPESLQYSERGQQIEQAIENMSSAADYLDDILSCIEEARQ